MACINKVNVLVISNTIQIDVAEIEMNAIRSQGSGGQNVNKVSTAIHLRFDINKSKLPGIYKDRLLHLGDRRISANGVIVIKAQRYSSQDKNRTDALSRLKELIQRACVTRKIRRPTRPSKSAKHRRMDDKNKRGEIKRGRGKHFE